MSIIIFENAVLGRSIWIFVSHILGLSEDIFFTLFFKILMSQGLGISFLMESIFMYLTESLVNLSKIRKLYVKLDFQEFVFQ